MNISYQWLRSLAPGLEGTAAELADRLAMYGAPVEEIVDIGSPLSDVVVARVAEVTRHPDADRLSLCRVDAGGDELLPVVCGAPNVRAGRYYPFIPAGGELPGGVRVRRVKIRGEESRGMLCSERELGLGRDHEGILELHGDFEPGRRFIDAVHLDDVRLDVEVTPNRPDLLSHLGIARELAPGGVAGVTLPPFPGTTGDPPALALLDQEHSCTTDAVTVTVDAPAACPHYAGALIRGVTVGASPEWLASRLRAVGLRPISNVVDATNWVLYELGQPLHAFDLDKLGRDVVVRMARAGENLETLDGAHRELGPDMLVIADATRPVALAGVIGGRDTEVSGDTRDVFLECAIFDARVVRQAARALEVSTDASYRFERGVDPGGVERALQRAAELIQTVAGGEVVPVAASVRAQPYQPSSIRLRASRVEQVLGIRIGIGDMANYLETLGFAVAAEPDAAGLRVEVPGHRSYDVFREDDLVEEVARRHGYDAIPEELRPYRPSVVPPDTVAELEDRLRTLMVGRGVLEARTASFAPPDEGDVVLLRPLSSTEGRLRRALLPGLIRGVEGNFNRGARDVRLFELGTVFARGPDGERETPPAGEGRPGEPGSSAVPVESTRLSVILTGATAPPHWDGRTPTFDVWDLKGLATQLADELGSTLDPWDTTTAERASDSLLGRRGIMECARFLDERTRIAMVSDGDGDAELIGVAGLVRGDAIDAPPWAAPVWALEVDLAGTTVHALPEFRPLPTFPVVERDIALLVHQALPAARLEPTIRAAAGALLEDVGVFDVYAGESLGEDRRSIGFRLRFRAPDRTLTDDEIDAVVSRVLGSLRDEHGAEHRG